jgi:hypothetical protein
MKQVMLFLAGFAVGTGAVAGSTYAQKARSPLMEPYTPTRLEWLALDLESRFKTQLEGGAGVSNLDFTAVGPDTVLVSVLYTDDASAATVDAVIEQAKHFANEDADSYGWSKWVKIRVERKSISSSRK